MEVIILKNVDNVGLPGEISNVKPGYFRNFLEPRGLAVPATAGNLKSLEQKRDKLKVEADTIIKAAQGLGEQLSDVTLTFVEKVADSERLFGSVTPADIAEKLQEAGFDIQRRQISVPTPIKTVGPHTAVIKLQASLTATVAIVVEGEGVSEEEQRLAEEAMMEEEAPAEAENEAEAVGEPSDASVTPEESESSETTEAEAPAEEAKGSE